ncbi:VPS10 domain-containing protein [Wenyingzhuangia sp. 2_MG-2023]|uniref:VPS10 domain-containing protein n=1 Tax=Wenyingzhuangia sp. 2_MG-2023 TaxID=3062639 RepID=UPI0026E46C05|nr:Ig-like domain-containing protein [Wenyingzhuangia sp. 2_MG-2023]MDO6738823.1 Ig-like domain-containing protein [Wenyingzhuangia sp. 2_MG-2023]
MNQIKKRGFFCVVMLLPLLTIAQLDRSFFRKLEREKVTSSTKVTWTQFGPGNAGYANLLRYHPTLPGVVAQCPDMWNVYQSNDNGKDWYGITDPDGDGTFYHLRDLSYSYSDADFGLAISSSELWHTNDLGKTWTVVPNCPWYTIDVDGGDKNRWKKKVAAVAIDPKNKKKWFVAGGANVRGQNWLSSYKAVTKAKPHGANAINEGKLWRTTNGGKSWKLITKGLHSKAQIGRIIVNPNNTNQVFAASNYGLYRSEDGGDSWTSVSENVFDNDIVMDMDFYYHAKTGKFILYAIDQVQYLPNGETTKCTGGIFYSEDEGTSWKKINGDLGLDINQLTGGVPANYYKYIAKWFGISVAQAKKKYPKLPTEALQNYTMLSADPSREKALYIGFADPQVGNSIMPGRLWSTNNNGEKWTNTARLYEETWAKDKDYWNARKNPYHKNMNVGHYSPHMRFGKDYALRSMRALAVGVDGSVMIVSDHSTMLSKDHGETWQQVDEDKTPLGGIVGHGNSNLPGLTIAQDRRTKSTLLGSGEHSLWLPTGEMVNKVPAIKFENSAPETVSNLVFDPYDEHIVYATSNRQEGKQYIYKSTDTGASWKKHGVATPATNKWKDDFYTNGLTIDPINNQYLYFGITKIVDPNKGTKGGFYFSEDYGKTFQQSNNGLPSPARINDVQFDPRDTSRKSLFVAAEKNTQSYFLPLAEGGLYFSSDRGQHWEKVKTPKEVVSVQFVKFDNTNRMYITTGHNTGGAGVWYTDDFGEKWHQVFDFEGTESIDISPFDHNLIVVVVRRSKINQGVYLTEDRGRTWTKVNRDIVTPHQIEDVKFDVFDTSKMWLANLGTGFYMGEIKDGVKNRVVQMETTAIKINKGEKLKLKAKVVNSDAEGEKLIWKSENTGIAKVDNKGNVIAIGKGQTKIWATTKTGRYSDFSIVTILPKTK